MISAQGGIFGSVTNSDTFVQNLKTDVDDKTVANGGAEEKFEMVEAQHLSPPMIAPQAVSKLFIDAKPYRWPYNGNMTPQNTCFIVIDMQVDFCAE